MHAVETMAYAGAEPWHGLGVKVSEEARKDYMRFMSEAGLNWEVERVGLQTIGSDPQSMDDFAFATRRVSDKHILGSVGPRYEILQNLDAFQWFEPFIQSGACSFETAGSLFDGSRVWILAEISGEALRIAGDDLVKKYLLLAHSHDGSLAVNCGLTPTRVVCNNTLSAALGARSLFKTRHTQKLQGRLEAISEQIAEANKAFEKIAESYRMLAQKRASDAQVKSYVRKVMGFSADLNEKLSTKGSNIVDSILQRVYSGIGQDMPSARGTWWGAYNGVTEYLSHERGHNQDSRLNSLWFGDSAARNSKALELAEELALAA